MLDLLHQQQPDEVVWDSWRSPTGGDWGNCSVKGDPGAVGATPPLAQEGSGSDLSLTTPKKMSLNIKCPCRIILSSHLFLTMIQFCVTNRCKLFYEGARVRSVLSLSSVCLGRLIRQVWQLRLKEQPRISHMSLWQRDPPSYSSNSRISGLSWRTSLIYYTYFCTYISVTENKDQTNMWAKVITRQSIQEIKVNLNFPLFFKAGNRKCPPQHTLVKVR